MGIWLGLWGYLFIILKIEDFLIFIFIFIVGWGAAIFLFGAVVLLLCDKESEEIYYKEKKIVHESAMRDQANF
jgi:hypothetical protein